MAKAATSITTVATFKLRKETKGALMYEELDAEGTPTINMMGTVYVRKSHFGNNKPDTITVAISHA